METKWLEDFLSVAQTLNFSHSAKLRNVTQPAFCRRIRTLESWMGADLFDRGAFPTRLTPAGQVFLVHAREMLKHVNYLRSLLREQSGDTQSTVTFAMPHTLSITYFPRWLDEVEQVTGQLPMRIEACNTHDAVMQLVDGNCDLLMCYHHPSLSIDLDGDRFEALVVGEESLRPYAKAGANGLPLYRLPGSAGTPLPFLAYSPNTVLGRVVEKTLGEDLCQAYLYRRFEGDLAIGLKTMALHGHGIAWLPQSTVEQDVAAGTLALALDPARAEQSGEAGAGWSASMQVRLYRDRESSRPLIDQLWHHLVHVYKQQA
jgi:DNA-binding transcriptional LysR family regulator